jgi:peptide/nickel transport system permease protein
MATVTQSKSPSITQLDTQKEAPRSLSQMAFKKFLRHRAALFGVFLLTFLFLFVIVGSLIFKEDMGNIPDLSVKFTAPNSQFLMGTDQIGRPVLIRMIYGGQISLVIGVVSVMVSLSIGTLVGLVSGYTVGTKWGIIDNLLMRLVEALQAFPSLLLLLLLSSVLARESTTFSFFGREVSTTVVLIIGLIGFLGWTGLAKIVRSMVLSLREREFILAARTLGASDWRIIFNHLLPMCIAPIVVTATLGIGGAVVTESYLSFLGFGVQPPTATWGNIMESVRNSFDKWWLWTFPGLAIVIITLSINFIGDGLRDALDPTTRK